MTQAYLQIPVDEESKKILTINTHKGLFNFTRLQYGVASVPSIFQIITEEIFKDIPRVSVYIDNILVTGKDRVEHLKNLEVVFIHLEQVGFRLKKCKCFFMLPSVEYLGHKISAECLHPTIEKVKTVQEVPTPQDVTQLRAFLGLVNYYGRFLPDLAAILAPLYGLLQKNSHWKWEKNYSHIEKEALAIIYGVKKFHMYLFGRHFEIFSDHKPLQYMFNPHKNIPAMASARLQRWAKLLGAYDHTLRYKPGPSHGNADSLSRLPVDPAPLQIPDPAEQVLLMEMLPTTPLTSAQIKQWSRRDPIIAKVIDLGLHGGRDLHILNSNPIKTGKVSYQSQTVVYCGVTE